MLSNQFEFAGESLTDQPQPGRQHFRRFGFSGAWRVAQGVCVCVCVCVCVSVCDMRAEQSIVYAQVNRTLTSLSLGGIIFEETAMSGEA